MEKNLNQCFIAVCVLVGNISPHLLSFLMLLKGEELREVLSVGSQTTKTEVPTFTNSIEDLEKKDFWA